METFGDLIINKFKNSNDLKIYYFMVMLCCNPNIYLHDIEKHKDILGKYINGAFNPNIHTLEQI
jgi:hypothetical protein